MKLNFNNGIVDDWTLVLSRRNFEHLGQLTTVTDFTYKENMNAANEISFTIHKLGSEMINLKPIDVEDCQYNGTTDLLINGLKTYIKGDLDQYIGRTFHLYTKVTDAHPNTPTFEPGYYTINSIATGNETGLYHREYYYVSFKEEYVTYSESGDFDKSVWNEKGERLWDEVYDLRLIWIKERNEYFQIEVSTTDALDTTKTITGTSLCEAELGQTILRGIEINTENDPNVEANTYGLATMFYYSEDAISKHSDVNLKKYSLLHRILDKCPNYSIGHVDDSLTTNDFSVTAKRTDSSGTAVTYEVSYDGLNLVRDFSVDGTSVYDFLTGDCAEQFNCMITFDTSTRTINAYDLYTICLNDDCMYYRLNGHRYRGDYSDVCPKCGSSNIKYHGTDTTIFVSKENLTDSIDYSTDVDAVKNCFYIKGGDDDMTDAVANINPNGSHYIYYFSDETLNDMSDELKAKIIAYKSDCDSYDTKYSDLTEKWYDAIDNYYYYYHTMMPGETTGTITPATEAAKLTTETLTGKIGLKDEISYESSVETAIKNYAKLLIHTSYVSFQLNKTSCTIASDKSSATWVGTITVSDKSGKYDDVTTASLSIVVTTDYESYVKNEFIERLQSEDEDYYMYDPLGKIMDLTEDQWTTAMEDYGYVRLKSFYTALEAALSVFVSCGWAETTSEFYNEFYSRYKSFQSITSKQMDKRLTTANIWNEVATIIGTGSEENVDTKIKNSGKSLAIVLNRNSDSGNNTFTQDEEIDITPYISIFSYTGSSYTYADRDITNTSITNAELHLVKTDNTDVVISAGDTLLSYSKSFKKVYLKVTESSPKTIKLNLTFGTAFETMTDIHSKLDFSSYIGDTLFKEFASYRREDTYENSNFIKSDSDTNADLIYKAKQLFTKAKEDIVKSGEYQHSISSTLDNLLVMKEFAPIVNNFELGNWIRFRVDGNLYRLRLTSYTIDFGNLQTINTEFSNLTKTASGINDVKSILGQVASMSSSYSSVSQQAEEASDVKDTYTSWLENGLNSALTKINNNNNEEITIDSSGINARTWDNSTETYSPEQLRITHNILCFTDNNWESSSLALGQHSFKTSQYDVVTKKIKDVTLKDVYGLSSDFVQSGHVVGSRIYGSEIVAGNLYSTNFNDNDGSKAGSHINLDDGSFSFAGGRLTYDGDKTLLLQNVELDLSTTVDTSSESGQSVKKTIDDALIKVANSIKDVVAYYLATDLSSGVTVETKGWTIATQSVSKDKPYLWKYEIVEYNDDTTEIRDPYITSTYGEEGRGINLVVEYYAKSMYNDKNPSESSWSTSVPTLDTTFKYLWNYEVITYTNGETESSEKRVIGVYGDTGRGISKITNYYLATNLATGVTTDTPGFTEAIQTVTSDKKFLWNYEVITYTDSTTSVTTPCIIGTYGEKGEKGDTGSSGTNVELSEPLYYVSDTKTTTPAKPTAEITETSSTVVKAWTKTEPAINRTYPFIFGCTQTKLSNGTYVWSNVSLLTSNSQIVQWCSATDNTCIDGASIYTGSLAADKIEANSIEAGQIKAGAIDVGCITTSNLEGKNGWINLNLGTFNYGNKLIWNGTDLTVNATNIDLTGKVSFSSFNTSTSSRLNSMSYSTEGGVRLYNDPTFKNGVNDIVVYNNSGNGTVTHTRQAKSSDNPSDSSYEILIKNVGTSSPGCGGFCWSHASRANAVFLYRIVAKIPTGRNLCFASNSAGTGYALTWITSNAGTGAFTEYVGRLVCGSSGTFSSTGYFYIDGSVGSSSSPVTWYLSSATVYDMTKTTYTAKDVADNIYTSGTTEINGGKITTGTITALGAITAGTFSLGNGAFVVDGNGKLTATGATIDGKITSTSGSIGGWNIYSTHLDKQVDSGVSTDTYRYRLLLNAPSSATKTNTAFAIEQGTGDGSSWSLNSTLFKVQYNGAVTASNLTINGGSITLGSNFSVTTAGVLSASGADISGKITATSGSIGGWGIYSNHIDKQVSGASDSYKYRLLLNAPSDADSSNTALAIEKGTVSGTTWTLKDTLFKVTYGGSVVASDLTINGGSISIGSNFSVTTAGVLTATSVDLSGKITATSGAVGGWSLTSSWLYSKPDSDSSLRSTIKSSGDVGLAFGIPESSFSSSSTKGANLQIWHGGKIRTGYRGSTSTYSNNDYDYKIVLDPDDGRLYLPSGAGTGLFFRSSSSSNASAYMVIVNDAYIEFKVGSMVYRFYAGTGTTGSHKITGQYGSGTEKTLVSY